MPTLQEIENALPNGFHDAEVRCCAIDFIARTVVFDLRVWIGDDTDPERYRYARLAVKGLVFCVFDPPDPRDPFAEAATLTVDLCDADPLVRTLSALPEGAFAARFG